MFKLFDRSSRTQISAVSIINRDAPWMWAVRSHWLDSDRLSFMRADLDFLLGAKVDKERQFWVRFSIVEGREELVVRVPEATIGKNIFEAIEATIRSVGREFREPIYNAVSVLSLAHVLRDQPRCDDVHATVVLYHFDVITIIKPPNGRNEFNSLLRWARRCKLAAQG